MAIREITSKTPGAFCFLVYTIRENNVGNQSLFGAMKTVFDYPTRFAFINCSFDCNYPVYIFAGFITENGGTDFNPLDQLPFLLKTRNNINYN